MLTKENYFHAIQPIVCSSTSQSYGFEFLLRSKEEKNPLKLFQLAREKNCLAELDLLSIELYLSNSRTYYQNSLVFLNIFPSTIMTSQFEKTFQFIRDNNINNIIFELNESDNDSYLWKQNAFYEKLNHFKKRGLKIGMDDVGQGQSTLMNIVNIKPDFIKVDKFFASNLAEMEAKQQMIEALLTISNKSKAKLILEGVETAQDLDTAKQLGVNLTQGYYYGYPEAITI